MKDYRKQVTMTARRWKERHNELLLRFFRGDKLTPDEFDELDKLCDRAADEPIGRYHYNVMSNTFARG